LKEPLQIGQEKGLFERRVGAGAASTGVGEAEAGGLVLEIDDTGGEIVLVESREELRLDIAAGTRFS
jgi:hypothetical protein